MAAVKTDGKHIFVTVGNETIVGEYGSNNLHSLKIDETLLSCGKVPSNEQDSEDWITAPASDVSSSNFVFIFRKYLSLWKKSDWSLVSCRTLIKSASKVRFSPNGNNILISDKSGDVYIYSVDNAMQPGVLLLGHLSMLLDVICTPDEKYVITCDRDEKIRVSLFPNAYNINSYCLGHEEFVTSVFLLPHCKDILASSSGDGSIRLWHYLQGKELLKHECWLDLESSNGGDIDNKPNSNAIINCASFKLNDSESIISLIFDGFNGSLIYKLKGSFDSLSCEKIQTLTFDSYPCDIFSSDNTLWYVLNKEHFEIACFHWNSKESKFLTNDSDNSLCAVEVINGKLKDYDKSDKKNIISVLYKQSYDNVQEYLKRKNERIATENMKKNKIL